MPRAAIALVALLVSAQQPPPELTLRTSTRLVEVSLIVQDGKGRPVADLTPQDLELLEDGRPQKILFFQKEEAQERAAAVELPPNTFSNRLGRHQASNAAVTVILLDSLNTPFTDRAYAKEQVRAFLKIVRPSDRIALYSLGSKLRVLHEFTSDTEVLLSLLDLHRGENSRSANSNLPPPFSGIIDELGRDPLQAPAEREGDLQTADRIGSTLQALSAIARRLAGMPGRKNLIWVTAGVPLQMNMTQRSRASTRLRGSFGDEAARTGRALNDANIAVYSVDARGLFTNPAEEATVKYTRGRPVTVSTPLRAMESTWEGMSTLSDMTGGRVFKNRNDVDAAVAEAFEDARVSYSLAYRPEGALDGKWRRIQVRVLREGLRARHRMGYLAAAGGEDAGGERMMDDLVWSPIDATRIGINAQAARSAENGIELLLQVDPAWIDFQQAAEGRWSALVELLFVQRDAEGRQVGRPESKRVELTLKEETYRRVKSEGWITRWPLPEAKGAAALKIAVRDIRTGAAGSLSIPFRKLAAAPARYTQ